MLYVCTGLKSLYVCMYVCMFLYTDGMKISHVCFALMAKFKVYVWIYVR